MPKAQRYLEELEGIGWFTELPPIEKTRIADQARQLLEFYDGDPTPALAITSFDHECVEGHGVESPCSYTSIIRQLGRDSYGIFKPKIINDSVSKVDPDLVTVWFQMNERSYELQVNASGPWFSTIFLSIINRAIREGGKKSEFIILPSMEHVVSLVLVPPDTYKAALRKGLVKTPENQCFD